MVGPKQRLVSLRGILRKLTDLEDELAAFRAVNPGHRARTSLVMDNIIRARVAFEKNLIGAEEVVAGEMGETGE